MQCLVAQAADRFADSPAISDRLQTISYREFNSRVAQVACRLKEIGVVPDSRVGIVLVNSLDQLILIMALIRMRAVVCPISTRLPKVAVETYLQKVNAALLITDNQSLCFTSFRSVDICDLTATSTKCLGGEEALSLNQQAVIIFTSGSTGESKAVLLTLGNLYYSALGSNQNIPFGPGDRWLLSLPLYHVGGLGILFRALLGGGTVVVNEVGSDLSESIVRHDITHLSLVSTQLHRLLSSAERPDRLRKRLKAVLLGGSGIPPELIRQSVKHGVPIHTSYGLTEMASQVTTTPASSPLEKLLTSGRLLPHRELRVGISGEIEVRGEARFAGYVNGQVVMMPFDTEGWYATGDIGSLDSDGYLTVNGRLDTMFISGGENIYPEEIERALYLIDGVSEAVVVSVPHREYGLRPCAFIRIEREPDPDRIRDSLREFLPSFKIPDRIFAWPSGAVSAGFKPDRNSFRLLAERLCSHGH